MSEPIITEISAISDPGEVNRDTHTRGDRFVVGVANVVAWAFPLLMVCIVGQVTLRGLGNNQAWLDDLQWWIYGFAMMAGLAYAITTNSHVRVDILHQNFSAHKKARIEAFALGWMMIPFLFLMTDILIHYAWASVEAGEGSDSPNGLHHLYILKLTMPLLFILACVGAFAAFKRNLRAMGGDTWFRRILFAFPALVFVLWRILVYVFYWGVFFTNSEIRPRRITREPIFDYLLAAAFVVVLVLLVLAYLRRNRSEGTV